MYTCRKSKIERLLIKKKEKVSLSAKVLMDIKLKHSIDCKNYPTYLRTTGSKLEGQQ